MGNLLTSVFPFAVASLMVGGVVMGSRLPPAQRELAGRIAAFALTVGTVGLMLWLVLRSNNPRLRPSLFVPLAITVPMLSRLFVRTPRARRVFMAVCGVLMLAFGFTFPYLLPHIRDLATFEVFRWAMVFCGVIMIVAAWRNWLPPEETGEDEGPLRPALGRPPRHFGGAS